MFPKIECASSNIHNVFLTRRPIVDLQMYTTIKTVSKVKQTQHDRVFISTINHKNKLTLLIPNKLIKIKMSTLTTQKLTSNQMEII